ncbi:hypothetical protein [Hymenobacter metallilatus]|uniref:Uncharacterized protein n=1 Tax=Hymenobacter metallilatus TaxID=2493666 RepID=A0A428JCZ4_9BACT|nr:hypothetical protein [Hymenobacter metallilatus]RSK29849.1 hypothetical protein EI290_16060 [Hymenobacter metallilatus]
MSNATPEFKEFNNGTEFMAQQIWIDDKGLVAGGIGVWEWAQASAVLGPTEPRIFPDAQYPVCSVLWGGQHLHIRADFKQVLTAYLRYKQRYGGQYIRLLAN